MSLSKSEKNRKNIKKWLEWIIALLTLILGMTYLIVESRILDTP